MGPTHVLPGPPEAIERNDWCNQVGQQYILKSGTGTKYLTLTLIFNVSKTEHFSWLCHMAIITYFVKT